MFKFIVALIVSCGVLCGAVPLDLSRAANSEFRDDTADDGKGGWTDQGAENDLRTLAPGVIRCAPVEFRIAGGRRAAIVLGKTPRRDFASSARIDLNGKTLKTLFLLHAAAWLPAFERPLGYIRIAYMDGSEEELPVLSGRDVGNWWEPTALCNGIVAWEGRNPSSVVGLYASSFALRGGAVRHILLRRSGLTGLWMVAAVSGSATEEVLENREKSRVLREKGDWKRLPFRREVCKGSALDFSFLLDAPAGKYGFLKVENGHFVFERNDRPVRFYGANLVHAACFPSHDRAEELAEISARTGYNVIRLHHFDDKILASERRDSVSLHPGQLDNFEYLIAALKKRGIYVTIDLFMSRKPAAGEFPQIRNDRDYKLAAMLIPEVNRNLKEFSRNLLTHRNPYTGLTLAEEPALLKLSIINENTPFHLIMNGVSKGVRERYRAEFERRYPGGMKGGEPDPELFRKFISDVYIAYYKDMAEFLRGLGVRVPLTEQNFIASPNLAVHRELYDYVDQHLYYDHPVFPEKTWELPMKFHGRSVIADRLQSPARIAPTRLFDRPFTVSEFDFSGPGDYRMQGTPIFAAYAALQDWDALNRFAYSHTLSNPGCFDAADDPVRLLGDRLAAVFFLRRDVKPARNCVPVAVSPEAHKDYRQLYPEAAGELALRCRTGSIVWRGEATRLPAGTEQLYALAPEITGEVRKGVPVLRNPKNLVTEVASSTGELHVDFRRNLFRAVTPRSETLILPEGETLSGGILTVRNRKSACAAGVIALDNRPLPESSRLLVLHIGNVRREGLTLRSSGMVVEDYGSGPLLVRKAVADFTLALPPAEWKLYALDCSGRRLAEIPFERNREKITFVADTFARTGPAMAYELVRPAP